ncbi:hypothetical protein SCHPADRAFT_725910 [Schizopora paradoxa]|uniref:Uncharacterized protein n=1 Tax=Schizopora paradoxa TaxID=27342 RepID=A0A0H2R2A1_9AGAM|nr:hypothetical protein SCHPADRAFT_725910 [Schizopora paradoxa]
MYYSLRRPFQPSNPTSTTSNSLGHNYHYHFYHLQQQHGLGLALYPAREATAQLLVLFLFCFTYIHNIHHPFLPVYHHCFATVIRSYSQNVVSHVMFRNRCRFCCVVPSY